MRIWFDSSGGGITDVDSAAGSGSITLSGSAANALRTYLGVATSGSITITGSAANGVYTALNNVASAADAGTITLTGSTANGVYTAVGAYNANAQSDAVALTGADAVGRHDYLAAAGAGSVAISGSDANAVKSLGATADAGSIVLTGSNALAIRTWLASADAGSITLAGSSANGVYATTGGGSFTPEQLAEILAYVEANMAIPTAVDNADAVWAHSTAVDFSDKMLICSRILRNKTVTNPSTGLMTVYADDGVTPYLTAQLYENVAETQIYRGQGAEVRNRLV